LIGQRLSERLGQPFIVENRAGAQGQIATEAVTRAPADGHTLLLVVPGNGIAHVLYDKLNFNFIRDIVPVAGLMEVPNIVVVHPSVPAKTVPELIAHAKANSGKLNMASGGVGTLGGHIAGEPFQNDGGRQNGACPL
jgi:tripartite-type tricarboxylate transporter receptor subunit TctC